MRLVIVGIMVFLAVIMACTLRLAGTANKNVLLENTLSKENLQNPQVLALAKEYKKRLAQLGVLFSLLSLSLLLPSYESVMMTLFWFLLLLNLGGFYVCELVYIRKMHQLIVKNHWQLSVEPTLVDTQLVLNKNQKIVSWLWLLPALALGVAGFIYLLQQGLFSELWFISLLSLVLWLLSLAMWYGIYRLPVRPMTNDAAINQQYNDLTKHDWSFFTVVMSIFMTLLLLIPLTSMQADGASAYFWLALLLIITVVFLVYTIWYLLRLRKKQDRLISQVPDYRYLGEDQYWRYGMYINPNDHRLMIPDRIGTNLSINLGRPVGKIIMGVIGLFLIAAMVFSLIPMYLFDFTGNPLKMQITQEQVTLSAPFAGNKTIQQKEIQDIQLVDQIGPSIKINGLGSENYAVGKFSVDGHPAQLYVDWQSSPILKIETKNQRFYYTNKKPKETKRLYQELKKSTDR